ncbi:MAG TPA: phosphoglycerate mutase (2,3-diphosphoglycerate-independent), partial [Actinobacteria bacterium]|nr:phosphoglycerate mutase (2,3-diphosphoglycerate-independent) [Actinomycetota bacterium]
MAHARAKPLILIILDGWGVKDDDPANAITSANTPNIDKWLKEYPNTVLESSGKAVGLPEGQMGNSEVGHLNIGAGRIVPQEFTKISDAIEDESIFNNPVLLQSIENAKKTGSDMHLMGLLSDGGVHSHIEQLFALLDLCKKNDIDPALHMFLDGRDVGPKSALTYIEQLEAKLKELETGRIATIMGRYYAMDRDKRWERVEKAYEAMVGSEGIRAKSAADAVKLAYGRGETDEFVQPTIISPESGVGSSESKTVNS